MAKNKKGFDCTTPGTFSVLTDPTPSMIKAGLEETKKYQKINEQMMKAIFKAMLKNGQMWSQEES